MEEKPGTPNCLPSATVRETQSPPAHPRAEEADTWPRAHEQPASALQGCLLPQPRRPDLRTEAPASCLSSGEPRPKPCSGQCF